MNEERTANFKKGFAVGSIIFGVAGLFSTVTAANDITPVPNGDLNPLVPPAGQGAGGQYLSVSASPKNPEMKIGANVPTADRGAFAGAGITICTIGMRTSSFWVGFICVVAVAVGMGMANTTPRKP